MNSTKTKTWNTRAGGAGASGSIALVRFAAEADAAVAAGPLPLLSDSLMLCAMYHVLCACAHMCTQPT
eukprot:scaffold31696_cov139-Isochrysis_galbana.AAC.7